MATRPTPVTDALYDYIVSETMTEHKILTQLREETAAMPDADLQISAEQGQFMALLIKLMDARMALEVGTFTGYSSTAVAMALPADGRLVCCDMSEEWTSVARRYWKKAGVDQKIELRLGRGSDTLDAMIADGESGTYDFVFIDADKENYPVYFEKGLELLRRGGLMMFDNMLAGGKVADLNGPSAYRDSIRSANALIAADPRVTSCLIQVGDGVTLAVKN